MNERVVIAMSGGVDSSVAAGILSEQGYDLVGITIKTYRYEDVGGNAGHESSCCSLDGINDARAVAAHLGFPHYVLDFSERFGLDVIGNFTEQYLRGRTPNPCVICNRNIKWEELIRKGAALGAGRIATGHYARVARHPETGRVFVSAGKDETKDQSYALWALSQDSLGRTIFPLDGLLKSEVRAIGKRMGLPGIGKGESFEICFIPDNNYERFLKERVPALASAVEGGEIVMDGEVVGHHRGYPFYTIGQRKGIGVFRPEPLYVIGIDPVNNRIEVGKEERLYSRGLVARTVNLQKYEALDPPRRVIARIRYKDPGSPALARSQSDGSLEVLFDEPKRAVTPGQSVVLYEGNDIVGGGVIETAIA